MLLHILVLLQLRVPMYKHVVLGMRSLLEYLILDMLEPITYAFLLLTMARFANSFCITMPFCCIMLRYWGARLWSWSMRR